MESGSESRWPTAELILKYFQIVMAFVYVALGIAILWKSDEFFNIPSSYSLPLGGILIAYGLVRGYRVYKKSL